jgi:hypothetical protein
VHVNEPTRPSRLFRSNLDYVLRGVRTMVIVYLIYRPTRLFNFLSLGFFIPALLLALRYLFFMVHGQGVGHVQSVIASGVLLVCSLFMAAIGVIAHLQSINRRLLEELRYLARTERAAKCPASPVVAGYRAVRPGVHSSHLPY